MFQVAMENSKDGPKFEGRHIPGPGAGARGGVRFPTNGCDGPASATSAPPASKRSTNYRSSRHRTEPCPTPAACPFDAQPSSVTTRQKQVAAEIDMHAEVLSSLGQQHNVLLHRVG